MLKLNGDFVLPPAAMGASNMDCRCIAKEIPQNFRSEKCEVKSFNSFCTEGFKNEELPLCELEKDFSLNNQAWPHLHDRYVNVCRRSESLEKENDFAQAIIRKDFVSCVEEEENAINNNALVESETSYFWEKEKINFQDVFKTLNQNQAATSFSVVENLTKSEKIQSNSFNDYSNCVKENNYFIQEDTKSSDLLPAVYNHQSHPYKQSIAESYYNSTGDYEAFYNQDYRSQTEAKNSDLLVPSDTSVLEFFPSTNSQAFNFGMDSSNEMGKTESTSAFNYGAQEKISQHESLMGIPNRYVTNPVQMHNLPGYNFYPGTVQAYTSSVGGERSYLSNPRENSAIKFHIHTITHCEVECPVPGALTLPQQPHQTFVPRNINTQTQENKQNFPPIGGYLTNPANILGRAVTSGEYQDHGDVFQNNENKSTQLYSGSQSYPNPLYSSTDLPHFLVQEQRKTSILIGYPLADNTDVGGKFVNSIPSRGSLTSQVEEVYNGEAVNEIKNQSNLYSSSNLHGTENYALKPPLGQAEMKQKTNLRNFQSSYPNGYGFPSHHFQCLPTSPGWISSKQTLANFPTQNPAFNYLAPSLDGFDVYNKTTKQHINYPQPSLQPVSTDNNDSNRWQSDEIVANSGKPLEKDTKFLLRKKNFSRSKESTSKKFSCSYNDCPKKFSKEKEMKVHINKHHLHLAKPYFCTFCSKSFKRPDQLKRHEKIHTGEKPHVCAICGRQFARTDHRNTHYKKHANGSERFVTRRRENDDLQQNNSEIFINQRKEYIPNNINEGKEGSFEGKGKYEQFTSERPRCSNFPTNPNHVATDGFLLPIRLSGLPGPKPWYPPSCFV